MLNIFPNFLSIVKSDAPILTLRVKYKTKNWFDIDVLNATQNGDEHYQKTNDSGQNIEKDNFK